MITLSNKELQKICIEAAKIAISEVNREEKEKRPEMVGVKEAARILGISENHMRKIKNNFPHIKNGGHQQGRILFYRDRLIPEYAK